jgi:hypothetical protein
VTAGASAPTRSAATNLSLEDVPDRPATRNLPLALARYLQRRYVDTGAQRML